MPDNSDPLDPLHEASFLEGQRAEAKKVSARRLAEQLRTLGHVSQVAAEVMNQVDQLAKDEDPVKQRIAARLKAAVDGAVEEVMTGPYPAEEGRVVLEATPFRVASQPSLNGSTISEQSLPEPMPKALTHEPAKRKRGRPRKST